MATFRCTSCGLEIEGRVPPIVCRQCQSRATFVDAALVPSGKPDEQIKVPRTNAATEKVTAEKTPVERMAAVAAAEGAAAEKVAIEKAEVARVASEKAAAERAAAEKAAALAMAERAAAERIAAEKAAALAMAERAAAERIAAEKAAAEKAAAERAARDAVEKEEAERAARVSAGLDRVIWRYRPSVSSSTAPHPLRGCPAVDTQGRAFAACGATLVMLSGENPTPQWIYSTGGPIPRSPVIGPDGLIRIHSTDGYLHLVRPDGSRVGEPAAVGPPLGWATPLVDAQNRTWIASSDGGLISVDSDGRMARRPFYRTRRRFDSTGVILGEVLYIGCEDHFVHAVSLAAERGENAWNGSSAAGRTGCAISCPVAITRGMELLIVSQDDQLHCFGLDGRANWTVPLPGQVLGGPVVDSEGGTIFLGVSQTRNQPPRGLLLAIDGATRQLRWQYATAGPVESTPVIGDDGLIYFGDNSGSLYAVDRHGALAWRMSLDAPVRSAGTFLAQNVVAFGLDDGSLVALRCSSQGLALDGWPKFQRTLDQSGLHGYPGVNAFV